MGRGRAKAKQTKVARDLKYQSTETDFTALQAELGGSSVLQKRESDNFDNLSYDAYSNSSNYENQQDKDGFL